MTGVPQDLIAEITRYAVMVCEQWASDRAKEEYAKALESEGLVKERLPDQKRSTRRKEAKALILQGLSDSEVADRTDFCPAMVQRLRASMGIYRNPLDQTKLFEVAFSLMNTSKSYAQVALDHDIGKQSVKGIAKKMKAAGLRIMDRPRGRPKGIE